MQQIYMYEERTNQTGETSPPILASGPAKAWHEVRRSGKTITEGRFFVAFILREDELRALEEASEALKAS